MLYPGFSGSGRKSADPVAGFFQNFRRQSKVAPEMGTVVGIGGNRHRDTTLKRLCKQFRCRIGFSTLFEVPGGIKFDRTAIFLQNIQHITRMGKIFAVVDQTEFLGQIKVSDKGKFFAPVSTMDYNLTLCDFLIDVS